MKEPRVEAERWWRQALSDYDFIPKAREIGKYDTCCFLAQQCAEKALKAFLYSRGEELIFTHSVFKLCELAAGYEAEFSTLRDQVKQLDFYYVEARYPNAIEDVIPAEFYGDQDASEAIEMAGLVISALRKYLKSSTTE